MDARIQAWQEYLKTSPLGVSYTGLSDGYMNDALKASLSALEGKLKEAGKPTSILSGNGVIVDASIVKSTVDQIPKPGSAPGTISPAVVEWKKYLQSKGLYSGKLDSPDMDDAFKTGMQSLEALISKEVPSVVGMIWSNGNINPQATIPDVEEALKLIEEKKKSKETKKTSALKFGVANFDALGPPNDPEFIGTPFKQLFISQEMSKSDEQTPGNSQNQGAWALDIPDHDQGPLSKKHTLKRHKKGPDIEERMNRLVQLMEQVKK